MNKVKIFILWVAIWGINAMPSFAQQQHINADLLKDGTTWVCARNATDLTYASLYKDEIQLKHLGSNQSGNIDFTVKNLANSSVKVSLAESNNLNNAYYMEFAGTTLTIQGITGLGGTFANGDQFKIERCNASIVFYGPGGNIYHIINGIDPSKQLIGRVEVSTADQVAGAVPNIEIDFPNIINNCVPPVLAIPYENYTAVERKLDGGYILVDENKIRIKYIQDYAIVANENDFVQYAIYDWKKQIPSGGSGQLQNTYGVNWHEITTPSLVDGNYYLLELKGLNKGEIYYLRFLYKCPPGVPCAG